MTKSAEILKALRKDDIPINAVHRFLQKKGHNLSDVRATGGWMPPLERMIPDEYPNAEKLAEAIRFC